MASKLQRIRTTQSSESFSGQETNVEEPLTPAGRVFLRPELYLTALCTLGFRQPVDVEALKQELSRTLVKHKRFSSVVRLNKQGHECWVPTKVNIEDHVIVPKLSDSELESERVVEEYAAKLSQIELDINKPMWEAHVINTDKFPYGSSEVKAKGVCIFVLHHSLGDGTSLMSLLLACTRRTDDPMLLPTIPRPGKSLTRDELSWSATIWRFLLVCWYSLTEISKFLVMQLWQSDSQTVIKGYKGAEKDPRHFSIVQFKLHDLKRVKNAASTTINDVLMALLSMAFKEYLKKHMDDAETLDKLRVRALAIMNTRASPGLQELSELMKNGASSKARWGNSMGYMLIPLTLKDMKEPLDYVREAKSISTKKKLCYEPHFTYAGGALYLKLFGVKAAAKLTYQSVLHTSVSVSNIVGPVEEVSFAGNSLAYIIPSSSRLPQCLLLHLTSYMGTANLSLMVNKRIITDPDFLSECFVHALNSLLHEIT